jgi:mannose-6-phosphate isomerase-like protein (cupin superfamily)
MNNTRVKRNVAVLVFAGLVGSIFVSGCSAQHNDHHNYEQATIRSEEPVIMNLTDSPEYQPLLSGRPQTCGMRSGRVYLKPGEDCGQHSTEAHEEMLVFLSGKGTALIGEGQPKGYEVGQGKVSYIPPYTVHNMKNTGTEPLVYIYCVVPVNPAPEDHGDRHEHHH